MLSSLAKDILNNPNKLLSFNHGAKKTVESGRIYDALSLSSVCSKPAYAKALNKAKTTPRSFMPETKDPGFAQNTDDLYLPKVIN